MDYTIPFTVEDDFLDEDWGRRKRIRDESSIPNWTPPDLTSIWNGNEQLGETGSAASYPQWSSTIQPDTESTEFYFLSQTSQQVHVPLQSHFPQDVAEVDTGDQIYSQHEPVAASQPPVTSGRDALRIHDLLQTPPACQEKDGQSAVAAVVENHVDCVMTTGDQNNEPEFDTCLGSIHNSTLRISRNCTRALGSGRSVVNLRVTGPVLTVHLPPDDTLVGLLDSEAAAALSVVSSQFSVQYEGVIMPVARSDGSGVTKHTGVAERDLHINIYSPSSQDEAIGDILMERDVYLQQPVTGKLRAPYRNPQYLLIPGETHPVFESTTVQETKLDESVGSKQGVDRHIIEDLLCSTQVPENYRRIGQSDRLKTQLQEHQLKGLAWMNEKENGTLDAPDFSTLWRPVSLQHGFTAYKNLVNGLIKEEPNLCLGGLLADEMGLGKTLTTLALVTHTLDSQKGLDFAKSGSLDSEEGTKPCKTTLVITPKSTLAVWEEQLEKHVKNGALSVLLFNGRGRNDSLSSLLKYDIVITTYGIVSREKKRLADSKDAGLSLFSYHWYRIVLDEAHVIRNHQTAQSLEVCRLAAQHRWCLTGTPIQNSLLDFGAILKFLKVSPFDHLSTFSHDVADLVEQAKGDISQGIDRLRLLVQSMCMRRTKKFLNLVPKTDRIESVVLTRQEERLYNLCKSTTISTLESAFQDEHDILMSFATVIQFILRLRQISNHGKELLSEKSWARLKQLDVMRDHAEAIAHEDATCEVCDKTITKADGILQCMHLLCSACVQKAVPTLEEHGTDCPMCAGMVTEIFGREIQAKSAIDTEPWPTEFHPSSKVEALLRNLHAARCTPSSTPIKSVVFSEWVKMLNLVERTLRQHGFYFATINGTMTHAKRKKAIEEFRTNPRCTVLLASIRSAGVGIDLTAASQVHLLEPQWNPMSEEQALDRIHRIGQTKPVTAVRYIVSGSIEEYVVATQEKKLNIIQQSFGGSKAKKLEVLREKLKTLHGFLTAGQDQFPQMDVEAEAEAEAES